MSFTNKNTLSNSKVNVDLPLTQDLFPSGTTSGDTGHPMIYHPGTKKMSLGEFPAAGGDTILNFARTGTTIGITTDKGTYAVDLNQKIYGNQVELLTNPGFDTQTAWVTSGGWIIQNSTAIANNGTYLYQEFTVPNDGIITIKIVVDSVVSGSFSAFTDRPNTNTPAISAPGTYSYDFTVTAAPTRFYLVGANFVFNGVISEVHVYQNGVLLQDAYDSNFLHKTGNEKAAGNKTFTDSLNTPVYKLDGALFASITSLGPGNGNILYVGNFNDKLSLIAYNTVRVISSNFVFEGSGTGKEFTVRNSGEVTASGYITATGFIGDGSQLTNLPAAGSTIKQAVVFTATANGAQTIPLGAAATGLVSVTCLETGTNTATRVIWESFCTIVGTNLQIIPDAGIRTGDKILVKYHL